MGICEMRSCWAMWSLGLEYYDGSAEIDGIER